MRQSRRVASVLVLCAAYEESAVSRMQVLRVARRCSCQLACAVRWGEGLRTGIAVQNQRVRQRSHEGKARYI